MELDDQAFRNLLNEAQNGSQEAAFELVERYGAHILRAVRRKLNRAIRPKFDSVDFVQAVWASFFEASDSDREFEKPNEFVAYLAATARHKVIDEVRRRMKTEKYNVNREYSLDGGGWDMDDGLPAENHSPSQEVMAEELWARMLKGKPERHRQILELRRQGHTCQQIADSMGLNEKTVRRVIQSVLPASES